MWARICELILAACMASIPMFASERSPELWAVGLGGAAVIGLFSGLSFTKRFRRIHLLLLPFSLILYGVGRLTHEGFTTIALLLLMFSLIPSQASLPPPAWRSSRLRS